VYTKVRGWIAGDTVDPKYSAKIELLSGELKYFGRTFFVKGGVINLVKEAEGKSTRIDITLVNPSGDINIFLNVMGDMEVIPVARALFKQLGYIGDVKSGLASLLGVEISFSTQMGSQGEVGFGINVRKKIARAFSIEYQQSTLKDPRATYYGLPRGLSFYGRIFSDRTSELKLRFIRKFDF